MILRGTQKYQLAKQNGLICELGVIALLYLGSDYFGFPEKRALVLSFPISLLVIGQKIYSRQSEVGKSKCY